MLNSSLMASFNPDLFRSVRPFPYFNFQEFLTPEAFEELYRDYPAREFFEMHTGLARPGGQRPHDRFYLAYASSIYKQVERKNNGVVQHHELPESWQKFLDELKSSCEYRAFLSELLGTSKFEMRFAWHIGVAGSEVSPHLDAAEKIGTHLFYFNKDADWDRRWGGATLALEGKTKDGLNPDFTDFKGEISSEILNNRSFLFKNTTEAWHGVRKLNCPESAKGRRLFTVICDAAGARKMKPWSALVSFLKGNKKSSETPSSYY